MTHPDKAQAVRLQDLIAYVEQLRDTRRFPITKRTTETMMNEIIAALSAIASPDDGLTHAEWMDILENCGLYPQSISGGTAPYEKRTDYMNGWNQAIVDLTNEVVAKLKAKLPQPPCSAMKSAKATAQIMFNLLTYLVDMSIDNKGFRSRSMSVEMRDYFAELIEKAINETISAERDELRRVHKAHQAHCKIMDDEIEAERRKTDRLHACAQTLWPFVQCLINDHLAPLSTVHSMAQGWVNETRNALAATAAKERG